VTCGGRGGVRVQWVRGRGAGLVGEKNEKNVRNLSGAKGGPNTGGEWKEGGRLVWSATFIAKQSDDVRTGSESKNHR